MSDPVLRAKLRVSNVSRSIDHDGSVSSETVQLQAVYGKGGENAEWAKWTPGANFTMTISNPDAFGKLGTDHEFYVDFTPANPTA